MHRLTDNDIDDIIGTILQGYQVEYARIKRGIFTNSDHYGFVLGRSNNGHYVTWQFHLDENEESIVYWGHYFSDDREAALRDFDNRDLDGSPGEIQGRPSSRLFKVRIIEMLTMVVAVEAENREEAEQIISDNWHNSVYILDAENFSNVEFIVCENNEELERS